MATTYALRTLAQIKAGDHLSFLYENEDEHRKLTSTYVRHGVKRNERVLLLNDATEPDVIFAWLRDDGVDVEGLVASGQLRLRPARSVFAKNAQFRPEDMISVLWNETQRALADGFKALRVACEMSWVQRGIEGGERLFEYEMRLNTFLPGSYCLMMCQYDQRKFRPMEQLEALNTHPVIAIGHELYDNFYYVPPDDTQAKDPLAAALRYRLNNLADRKEAEEQLRDRERKYRSIYENALEGIFQSTPDGRYISVNPALARLYGFDSPDDLMDTVTDIGRQIYVSPQRREEFLRAMRENGQVLGFESEVRRKDGSVIWISENVHAVRNAGGTIRHFEGTIQNITERKRQARRVVALHNATQILSRSTMLTDVSHSLLQSICESLEWPLGAIWSPSAQGELRCADIWHGSAAEFKPFVQATQETTFARGTGLPGRVWASGQPAWINDVVRDGNFPRAPFAAKAGLHGAFAFPISVGSTVLSVFEFFTREIQDPDDDLLTMMATLGTTLGLFVERQRLLTLSGPGEIAPAPDLSSAT